VFRSLEIGCKSTQFFYSDQIFFKINNLCAVQQDVIFDVKPEKGAFDECRGS